MRRKQQPTEFTCGQTCIAILAKVPVKKVIKAIGPDPISSIEIRASLNSYNIKHGELLRYLKKISLPHTCILFLKDKEFGNRHWLVKYGDRFLDPDMRDRTKILSHEKITSFIEIGELA